VLQNLAVAVGLAIGAYLLLRILVSWRARIAPAEARAKVEGGALLLDVRTPAEFAAGSIEGAINIPLQRLEASFGELDNDQEIVVFCASGMRSARSATLLKRAGFTVHDLGPKAAW